MQQGLDLASHDQLMLGLSSVLIGRSPPAQETYTHAYTVNCLKYLPPLAFLVPRTFLARFLRSFWFFLDFSTFLASPFLISLYLGSNFLAWSMLS
jgi:hypothetical protein